MTFSYSWFTWLGEHGLPSFLTSTNKIKSFCVYREAATLAPISYWGATVGIISSTLDKVGKRTNKALIVVYT